ncbi:msx2-interacting protein-like [Ambystoma mexicanum]|uniref:msx2-interacting protein-like n=1 Tax=Ambystoma mexicanum TaxID=8296 RepID=UPI0037E7188D
MDAGDARSRRRAARYASPSRGGRERGLNGASGAYKSDYASLHATSSRPFSRLYDRVGSERHKERSPYTSKGRLGRSRDRSPYIARQRSPYISRSPLGLGSSSSSYALRRSPVGLSYARSTSPYLHAISRARSPLGLGYSSSSRSPYSTSRTRSPLWLESSRRLSPLGLSGFSSRSLSPSSHIYLGLPPLRHERFLRAKDVYAKALPPPPRRAPRYRSRSPHYYVSNHRSPPPPARYGKERAPRTRRSPAAAAATPRYHIRVKNFPAHYSDESVRQGLQYKFKKYGAIPRVQVHGEGPERYAVVTYKKEKEREEALADTKGSTFFGVEMEVAAWEDPDNVTKGKEWSAAAIEFHQEISMTLYVGNLGSSTTPEDLAAAFKPFGEVLHTEVKMARRNYGFVQYSDARSVTKAIKEMNGRVLGKSKVYLGFGRNLPSSAVWVYGLQDAAITEAVLTRHFGRYGRLVKVLHDAPKGTALAFYKERYGAAAAVKLLRRDTIEGHVVKALFASTRVQQAFCRAMEAAGQDIGELRDLMAKKAEDEAQMGELTEEERLMVAEASDEEEGPMVAEASDAGSQEEEDEEEEGGEEEGDDEEDDAQIDSVHEDAEVLDETEILEEAEVLDETEALEEEDDDDEETEGQGEDEEMVEEDEQEEENEKEEDEEEEEPESREEAEGDAAKEDGSDPPCDGPPK